MKQFLSEEYKARLLELSGIKSNSLLTEIDNRDIIVNKIGLSQEIANWVNNLSGKYAIWIANQIKTNSNLYPTHESEFRYILDWKKANPNVKLNDFNFDNALKQAKIWHEEFFQIQSGDKHPSSLENEDIFMKSGDMYWVKITNPEQCEREGGLMGHCMGGSGHPQKIKSGQYVAYSLRDKENHPHITIEIDKQNGNIIEFKGKSNKPPIKQYIPYAFDFLKHNKEWKQITDDTFVEMLQLDILMLKQFINLFPNGFDKNEMLRLVSYNGHLGVVKYLVEKGADVHADNDYVLRRAAENGHLELVKYLIEKGADVHAKNDLSLRLASERGYLEMVKYLVEKGADVHAENDYALKWASYYGHLEVVKYLIEKGADVHAENDYSLRWASERGHLGVVKYLIEKGADVYANDDFALKWASQNKHLDVAKYLKSVMEPIISENYKVRLLELSGQSLLQENRIDFLRNDFMKDAEKHYEKKGKHQSALNKQEYLKLNEEYFNQIVQADPSHNKQYSQWLLNLYKKGELRLEDLYKVTEYLQLFDTIKPKIPVELRDINKYQSLVELYNSIKSYEKEEVLSTSQKEKMQKLEGANRILDNNHWLVLVPKNEEAACLYGRDTKWCTSATGGNNRFEGYNSRDQLFIIIDKTISDNAKVNPNKKFQFFFRTEEFMNASDESVNITKFFSMHPDLLELFEKLGKVDASFKMKHRLLPKQDAIKLLEDSSVRIKLVSDYGIKWFVYYFVELGIVQTLKNTLVTDNKLIDSILSNGQLKDLVDVLDIIKQHNFAVKLLTINNKIILDYFINNSNIEQLINYCKTIASMGPNALSYLKTILINTNFIYDIFKKYKELPKYYNLVSSTDVFGNEGLYLNAKMLLDPKKKADFIKNKGKDIYLMYLNFVKEHINMAKTNISNKLTENFKNLLLGQPI